jgi:glycerophosphoryl diester phosphodiesterase
MSEGKPAKLYGIFARKSSRPLVIAHRGGAGIAPENTLFAFKRSADLGADVLELDIRSTSDGELVVIHDANVDRTTDGKAAVAELTLQELKRFDAGFRWTEDGGKTFPFRGQGIKIPTLREVFEAFPDIKINIEPKHVAPSPVTPLCGLITEFNREDKVIVGTFRDEVLEDFRQNCKGVATSASPSEASFYLAGYEIGLSKSFSPEMQVLQIPERLGTLQIVTEEYIKSAHERNLDVHVWTINDVEDMKRLIKIKADGIMTNYPDRLLDLLKSSN